MTTQKEAGALHVARCRSVVFERDPLDDGRSQEEGEQVGDHPGCNSFSHEEELHEVSRKSRKVPLRLI